MTTKSQQTARMAARMLPPLPDPPPRGMEQFKHFIMPGVATTLGIYLGSMLPDSTTLVGGHGYLCRRRSDFPSCPYPDLVVAFDIDPVLTNISNGYVIEEVGKPPDLVMEVASSTTGSRDYIAKRTIYADLSVPEYWRHDHTGGSYHDAALAGDLLIGDVYQSIEIVTEPDGVQWGFSEKLGLSVCWLEGKLRFWDRARQRYLPEQMELAASLSAAQAQADAAQAQAAGESRARADAEARIRQLEEELRRRQDP